MSTGSTPLSKKRNAAGRIIKVNHAGEHGAVNIYAGQIAAIKRRLPALATELAEFQAHEERHRAIFAQELQRRQLRRCRSFYLCGIGGYMLGLISGLMGSQAIAITTVAVERVVLRHIQHQLRSIGDTDPDASAAISAILSEELHHHDQSASHITRPGRLHRMMGQMVSGVTESVIWIGMRI